jgi:chromosome segregation ATPase
LTFDSDGHVIDSSSYDLDNRYYTETEIDTNFVNASGDIMTGDLYVNGANITASGLKILNNIVVDGTVDSVNILETSQSISTRLTINETDIDNLQSDSASFSTRLTTTENEIDALQLDSASFSSRITTNESNINNLQSDSASFSTRITNEEITSSVLIDDFNYAQSVGTNNNVEFNNITSSENVLINNSLYVLQAITGSIISSSEGIFTVVDIDGGNISNVTIGSDLL